MKHILIALIVLSISLPAIAEESADGNDGSNGNDEVKALKTENAELTAKIAELNATIKRLNDNNRKLAAENVRLKKELAAANGKAAKDAETTDAETPKPGTIEAFEADLAAAGYDLTTIRTYPPEQAARIKKAAEKWNGKKIKGTRAVQRARTGGLIAGIKCNGHPANSLMAPRITLMLEIAEGKFPVTLLRQLDGTVPMAWSGTVYQTATNYNEINERLSVYVSVAVRTLKPVEEKVADQ